MNTKSRIIAISLCAAQLVTMMPVTASAASSDYSVNTIAVGENHSLVIRSDKTLWAAGDNSLGQLGLGTDTDSSSGAKVMDKAVYVAANDSASFAIDENGTLYGWGDNSSGQISPSTTDQYIYKPLKLMDNVEQVSAGDEHTVALLKDGSVVGWGSNVYGELGFSANSRRNSSTKLMDNAADIAAGDGFTLIVTKSGEVYSCGNNEDGQLGTGDYKDYSTLTKVVSSGAAEAEAGNDHSIVLMSDGTVYTCGLNESGQLGYSTYYSNTFSKISLTGARAIFAGGDSTGAVTSDGTLYTWGSDDNGQLLDGYTEDTYSPTKISSGAISVAFGEHHSVMLSDSGKVQTAGTGSYGELFSSQSAVVTKPAYTAKNITVYAAGKDHSAAIDTEGKLYTWGSNDKGQLGTGDYNSRSAPTRIKLSDEAVDVWCGDKVTIVQTSSNDVYVFGDNSGCLLGMKTKSDAVNTPTLNEYLSGSTIEKIEFASGYALALIGGTVYGWGTNSNGRLCGCEKTVRYPETVDSALTGATDIAAGESHAFALIGGVLYGWGSNSSKQLSQDIEDRYTNTPTEITLKDKKDNALTVTDIAAAGNHSIAATSDGDVYAWGENGRGQLGTDTYRVKNPEKVAYRGENVYTSDDFSAVVNDMGDLTLSGSNDKGQLGNGTTKNLSEFNKSVLDDVKSVSLGSNFGGAIDDEDKLYCWGDNTYGQVGNGASGANTEPQTVYTDGLCKAAVKVTGITLDNTALTLKPKKTATLKATVTPDNASNKTVTWQSSDSTVATVSSTGLVKAIKNGTAVITAKTENGLTAQCTVTVSTPVSSFSVTPGRSKTLNIDGTFTFKAKIYPSTADDKTLLYTSSDESVVLVDENGTVTAVAPGSAKITITAKTNTAKTRTVTVKVRPDKVVINYRKSTTDGVTLGWEQADYAEGYVVYRRSSAKGKGKVLGEVTTDDPDELFFTDDTAVKGKTYYYYVKSYVTVNGSKLYSSASKIYKIKAK